MVQVYVDDIIFGSINEALCEAFVKAMKREFEMTILSEVNYFIRLQVKQSKDDIFIYQTRYCKDF